MQNLTLPSGATPSALPTTIRLAIASSSVRPPEGDDWLHEVKYDGHRIVAVLDGRGRLKLISRNGRDRTPLFRTPFRDLLSCGREIVLDGEIAVPDDRGVTHIGHLQDALDGRQPDRLAYFAFDLLYLDGHDLRRCPIEERKALLRRVLNDVGCPRLVFVDHVRGWGAELFEHVRAIGAEGIVSKRVGSLYTGKATREWRKTKCHATGQFIVTGFQELGPGRLEALHVAEELDGVVVGAGQVRFGFAGKGLWAILDELRAGSLDRAGVVPIEPRLVVRVKYFGRHKGGAIRDGVLVAMIDQPQRRQIVPDWSCDADAVIAAMDAADGI